MFIKKLIRTKPNLQKVALILFAFFILYTPPSDPDFGWHYRYGEYIFNNQKLLTENIFSHQMLDYEWVNSYILSELIMYLPIHFFGEVYGPMILSLVLSIALSILLFHAFSKAFTSKPKLYISMFLLPLILAKYVVTVRPLFFSTIFLLILVNILLYRKKLIKFLPILFLFWANMHAGWMLGLFAFGLYYGEQVLRQKKILFNKTLLLVSLSFAAVLINPYGYKLYEQMFFKEASSIQFNISEWSPVSTGDGGITPFFVFYTISLSLIAVSTWELRKKTPLWLIGSILLFWILSFRAQYFLRVVLIFGIFPITIYFGGLISEFEKVFESVQKKKINKSLKIVSALLFTFLFGFFVHNLYLSSAVNRWSKESKYPYESVQIIQRDNLKGNLFNTYGWGGYLIWQLPERKVFIAGYMPTWRDNEESSFEEYLTITKEKDGYLLLNSPEYNDINLLLLFKEYPISDVPEELPGWEKYFESEYEVLFIRN